MKHREYCIKKTTRHGSLFSLHEHSLYRWRRETQLDELNQCEWIGMRITSRVCPRTDQLQTINYAEHSRHCSRSSQWAMATLSMTRWGDQTTTYTPTPHNRTQTTQCRPPSLRPVPMSPRLTQDTPSFMDWRYISWWKKNLLLKKSTSFWIS